MEVTREQMKKEAIKRMKMLRLMQNPIEEFDKEDKLNLSETGILYWLDDDQEKMVRDWEKETGNMVYHVIHDYTSIGEMYSLLFVSKYKEEWQYDRDSIPTGYTFAYVINKDAPECSEYGSIGVRPLFGGVQRTA